jgi:hypothetical protein
LAIELSDGKNKRHNSLEMWLQGSYLYRSSQINGDLTFQEIQTGDSIKLTALRNESNNYMITDVVGLNKSTYFYPDREV